MANAWNRSRTSADRVICFRSIPWAVLRLTLCTCTRGLLFAWEGTLFAAKGGGGGSLGGGVPAGAGHAVKCNHFSDSCSVFAASGPTKVGRCRLRIRRSSNQLTK